MELRLFDEKFLRLKQALRLTEDQEVAQLLGMTKAALSARKTRGAFPDEKVYALAAQRPELGLDVAHILNGTPAQSQAAEMLANFGPRLREVRGDRKPAAFAKLIGIAAADLEALECGRRWPTPLEAKRYVEAHPEHNASWLLGGDAPRLDGELDQAEVILIKNYRAATKEGKDLLRQQAAMLAELGGKKWQADLRPIPPAEPNRRPK